MKFYKYLTFLIASFFLVKGIVAQSYPNLSLEDMTTLTAPNTYDDPFFSNPQAGAWKISSGSPGVITEPSVLVPSVSRAIQIVAGVNLDVCWSCNDPTIDLNGDDWCPSPDKLGAPGEEGIYYEADFLTDHKYNLSVSHTLFSSSLGSPVFYIVLANNLPEVSNPITSTGNLCDAPIPNRSFDINAITDDMQIIHESSGTSPWTTWNLSFIPKNDYTQLWFVVKNTTHNQELAPSGETPPGALFSVNTFSTGQPGLTCCPYDIETITATEHRMEGLYGTSSDQLSWVSYYVHRSLRPYISAYRDIDIEAGAPFGITIKDYDPPVTITAGGTISITASPTYSFTVEPPTQVGQVKLDMQAGVDCDCTGPVNSICDNLIGGNINFVSEAQFLDNSTIIGTDPSGIPYLEWQNGGNRAVIIQDYLVKGHTNPFVGKWIPKTVGYTFPIPGFNYPREFNATKIEMLMHEPSTNYYPYEFEGEDDCGIQIGNIPWWDGSNITQGLPAFVQTQIDLENCYEGDNFFGNGLLVISNPNNIVGSPTSSLISNSDVVNMLDSDLEKEKMEKLSDIQVNPPMNNTFFPAVILSKTDVLSLSIYPNPTKELININYELEENSEVSIKILNSLSKVVTEISKGQKEKSGKYSIQYNATKLIPGMYFCEVKTQNNTITKRFIKQ